MYIFYCYKEFQLSDLRVYFYNKSYPEMMVNLVHSDLFVLHQKFLQVRFKLLFALGTGKARFDRVKAELCNFFRPH